MATTEPSQPSVSPSAQYDETQCIGALAQLEHLQNQLDDLRLTLPRIVEPFHMPSKPPMFHAFKDNLIKAQRDMKTFRTQWQSLETQSLFEHARQSAVANPDLSEGAKIQKYGWIEKEKREKDAAKKDADVEDSLNVDSTITKEEREKIVSDWKLANPSIKVEEREEGKTLLISFIADSTKYRFRISISNDLDPTQAIKVECEGKGEPFTAVTRCLASRPNANELASLLDMILAYKNVSGTSCAKCNRMLNHDATKPAARRSRPVVDTKETAATVWEAFHEGCLD